MRNGPQKKDPNGNPRRIRPSQRSSFAKKANDVVDADTGATRLMQAIAKNDAILAGELLEAGAAPDKQDKAGRSAMHIAAECGHLWAIDLLAKFGGAVNARDKELKTPLFAALSAPKSTEMIAALLKIGANPDIADKEEKLPLHLAAMKSTADTVSLLLQHTENPDKPDKEGFQPLHYACQLNNAAVVSTLLTARVPVDAVTLKGDSCLHLAMSQRDNAVIDCLLNADAPHLLNSVNLDGRTPLHLAAAARKTAIVSTLVKKGADPNAEDKEGRTPLHECARENDLKTARRLIALGADVSRRQKPNTESLLMQAINNKYPLTDMVELLLDHNAPLDAADKNGYTAIMMAVYRGHEAICRKLLDKGCDASKKDFLGRNALHYLDGTLPSSIIPKLIANGADINLIEGFQKRSPLMMMLQEHKTLAAHALIDAGADLNLQNINGHTALIYALRGNHPDLARKLIDKNTDLTLGEFGTKVTAIHVAAQLGNHDLFERMVKKGVSAELKDAAGCTPLHHSLMNGLASVQIVTSILKCGGNPLTPNDKGYTPYDYAYSDNRTLVTSIFEDHVKKTGKPRYTPRHPPRRGWWGGY